MRTFVIVLLTLIVAAPTGHAASQKDRVDCASNDPNSSIAGCTRVLADKSESQSNRASAYFNRGNSYRQKSEDARAIADYDQAIRLAPGEPSHYTNRGIAFSSSKNYDRAIADHNKAIELAPNNPRYYVLRGTTYQQRWINTQRQDDLERAKADYRAALRLRAGPDGMKAQEFARENLAKLVADEAKLKFDVEQRMLAEAEARRVAESNLRSAAEAETKRKQEEETRRAADPTASRRIALVIGNSRYANASRLNNPANDARAVAAALRRLGFVEVIERYDIGIRQLRDELKAFGDKSANADWAVVYFAGHGIQVGQTNYLIPTDAKLLRESHVDDEAVALPYLLSKVEDARQLRLVILDACRGNPFLARLEQAGAKRSLGRGLGPIEPQRGVLVAFAARDGQIAEDGTSQHSPFTEALLQYLEEPNIEIGLLFRKVRDGVLKRTGRTQEPFVYGSLPSERLFFTPVR